MRHGRSTDNAQKPHFEPLSYVDSNRGVDALGAGQEHHDFLLFNLLTLFLQGAKTMKPTKTGPVSNHNDDAKHSSPLGSQQAVAEKAANSKASVKARVDSKNMPDMPAKNLQHTPNSSGKQ